MGHNALIGQNHKFLVNDSAIPSASIFPHGIIFHSHIDICFILRDVGMGLEYTLFTNFAGDIIEIAVLVHTHLGPLTDYMQRILEKDIPANAKHDCAYQ